MNVILSGIGAGLVSALLTGVVVKATLLASLLYLFSSIPILIASLGWHHRAGLIATAVGAVAVATFISPLNAFHFVMTTGLPAWWLSYLALLRRSTEDGAVEWYPTGRLLAWIAVTAAFASAAGAIISAEGDYASLEAGARALSQAIVKLQFPQTVLQNGLDEKTRESFVEAFARLIPFVVAQGSTIFLTLQLYVSGRIVFLSGRLPRPWPAIAKTRLPRGAGLLLIPCIIVAMLVPNNFVGVAGMSPAGALFGVFALQGLALVHDRTAGRAFRPMILTTLYSLLFFTQGVLALALSLYGLADTVFGVRRDGGHPTVPPNPTL